MCAHAKMDLFCMKISTIARKAHALIILWQLVARFSHPISQILILRKRIVRGSSPQHLDIESNWFSANLNLSLIRNVLMIISLFTMGKDTKVPCSVGFAGQKYLIHCLPLPIRCIWFSSQMHLYKGKDLKQLILPVRTNEDWRWYSIKLTHFSFFSLRWSINCWSECWTFIFTCKIRRSELW